MNPGDFYSFSLGPIQRAVSERLADRSLQGFIQRMWERDHTLWSAEPLPELVDRLGWLGLPQSMHNEIAALDSFAREVRSETVQHVVLLGMGGSSLAPELFQRTFGNQPGYPELVVLDSTHPEAVLAVDRHIDPTRTLFLVASKSGSTLETLSFFRYFWHRVETASNEPGHHFVAITDPGSSLAQLAAERGFRRVFETPPEVGGRYSALTFFGLVPAALIGLDIHSLLDQAGSMSAATRLSPPGVDNPALMLGAAIGEASIGGRDKISFLVSPSLAAFPGWLEQLIAESTGKDDRGIVPVADEPLGDLASYGDDRLFVHLGLMADEPMSGDQHAFIDRAEEAGHPVIRIMLDEKEDLAREMFGWEVAVAVAGAVLGINPFNQPDVQLAKDFARKAMAGELEEGSDRVDEVRIEHADVFAGALDRWVASVSAGDYIAIQAYLALSEESAKRLQQIRGVLRDRYRLATTLGYGPRFLHSTGQLHKGGPNTGLFLQLVDEPSGELPVPETEYDFGALIAAQALGDYQALKQRGRRVLRLNFGADPEAGLAALREVLEG
jgi:transaldolase/glucose-6-phosphate isomerase